MTEKAKKSRHGNQARKNTQRKQAWKLWTMKCSRCKCLNLPRLGVQLYMMHRFIRGFQQQGVSGYCWTHWENSAAQRNTAFTNTAAGRADYSPTCPGTDKGASTGRGI